MISTNHGLNPWEDDGKDFEDKSVEDGTNISSSSVEDDEDLSDFETYREHLAEQYRKATIGLCL